MSNWKSIENEKPKKSSPEYTQYILLFGISGEAKVPFVIARAKFTPEKGAEYTIEYWEDKAGNKLFFDVFLWQPLPLTPTREELYR